MLSANVERNKQTVRKLFDEVINTGRLDLCDRYLAPDRVDHQDYGMPPGSSNGHDGFQRTLGVFLGGFPDLHLIIDFIIADEDRVAAYVTTEGTTLVCSWAYRRRANASASRGPTSSLSMKRGWSRTIGAPSML